ncbi:hypothetical protein THAOC_31868, partial [Thalassiosira oceanica]
MLPDDAPLELCQSEKLVLARFQIESWSTLLAQDVLHAGVHPPRKLSTSTNTTQSISIPLLCALCALQLPSPSVRLVSLRPSPQAKHLGLMLGTSSRCVHDRFPFHPQLIRSRRDGALSRTTMHTFCLVRLFESAGMPRSARGGERLQCCIRAPSPSRGSPVHSSGTVHSPTTPHDLRPSAFRLAFARPHSNSSEPPWCPAYLPIEIDPSAFHHGQREHLLAAPLSSGLPNHSGELAKHKSLRLACPCSASQSRKLSSPTNFHLSPRLFHEDSASDVSSHAHTGVQVARPTQRRRPTKFGTALRRPELRPSARPRHENCRASTRLRGASDSGRGVTQPLFPSTRHPSFPVCTAPIPNMNMKSAVLVASIALIVTVTQAAPIRKRNLAPQHKSLNAAAERIIQSDEAYDPYMGMGDSNNRKLNGKPVVDEGSMPHHDHHDHEEDHHEIMSMSMKPSEPAPSPEVATPDDETTEAPSS